MTRTFVDHDSMTPEAFVKLLRDQEAFDKRMGWTCTRRLVDDYQYSDTEVRLINPIVRTWEK